MVDTFSSQLRFVKQTNLGNTNIWGNNFNKGVINLADEAISGRVNLDVTIANVTLTMANGGVDTMRPMFLHVQGNPGATRQIVVPSFQKMWVVSNETNPGFAIEVKTVSSAGIIIEAGASALVFVDQVNDVVRSPTSSGNVVFPAPSPWLSQVYDVSPVPTSGDTQVTMQYQVQGGFTICRLPVIDTTIAASANIWNLTQNGGFNALTTPSSTAANNEFRVCMTENGVLTRAYFGWVSTGTVNVGRSDAAVWTAASRRIMVHPLHFILQRPGT